VIILRLTDDLYVVSRQIALVESMHGRVLIHLAGGGRHSIAEAEDTIEAHEMAAVIVEAMLASQQDGERVKLVDLRSHLSKDLK
jgi:hypothetical protein